MLEKRTFMIKKIQAFAFIASLMMPAAVLAGNNLTQQLPGSAKIEAIKEKIGKNLPKVIAQWDDKPVKKKNLVVADLTIRNWGQVTTAAKGYENNRVSVTNTTRFNFSSKKFDITARCSIRVGSKTTVCFDFLSGKVTGANKTDASCVLKGKININIPKLKAKLCATTQFTGTPPAAPKGTLDMKIDVEPGGIKKKILALRM